MTISPLAGKPAPKEMLVDLARLEREYFVSIRRGFQLPTIPILVRAAPFKQNLNR